MSTTGSGLDSVRARNRRSSRHERGTSPGPAGQGPYRPPRAWQLAMPRAEGGKGLGVCAFLVRCRVQDASAGYVKAIPAPVQDGVHGIDPGETQWWIFTLDAP